MHLSRPTRWRSISLLAFTLAGGLFITSGLNAKGHDLRAASVTSLDTVVEQERTRADGLQQQIAQLNSEIATLSADVGDERTRAVRQRIAKLQAPAGLTAISGPGITVTLDDTPREQVRGYLAADPELSANELTVHQQDIQAVVNALWAGGADAVTVQGQRIISTTGIRCVGNTVVLHGVPYAPPYRIAAIGDVSALTASVTESDYVNAYMQYVYRYSLGWDLSSSDQLEMPAYEGPLDLQYATPADTPKGAKRG